MPPYDDIRAALGDELPAEEREAVLRLAESLERGRPLPSPAFRGSLRRRLLTEGRSRAPAPRPRRLRALIAACAGSGAALLAIAAIGVAGAGPFAA